MTCLAFLTCVAQIRWHVDHTPSSAWSKIALTKFWWSYFSNDHIFGDTSGVFSEVISTSDTHIDFIVNAFDSNTRDSWFYLCGITNRVNLCWEDTFPNEVLLSIRFWGLIVCGPSAFVSGAGTLTGFTSRGEVNHQPRYHYVVDLFVGRGLLVWVLTSYCFWWLQMALSSGVCLIYWSVSHHQWDAGVVCWHEKLCG
jgi:hypothetical protein